MRWGAITGFIISWIAATAFPAISRPLPDWHSADLEIGLVGVFKKERGVALAAVLWRYDFFQGDGPRWIKAVLTAQVRTQPIQTDSRVSRGLLFRAFKTVPDGKAWFPGLPFRWNIQPGETPYIMVAPPPLETRSILPELRKRIYDQPIVVSDSLSDAEIVEALDFFWHSAIALHDHPLGPDIYPFGSKPDPIDGPTRELGSLASEREQYSFQNLAGIGRASELDKILREEVGGIRDDDFALTLSEDGDGYEVVFLRKTGPAFRILGIAWADF